MQQLGVGRKGNSLRPQSTVTRLRSWVLAAHRAGLMRHPQALGQQQLQFVAEPLAPMAQVRALVREGLLQEIFAGEELKYGSWTQRPRTRLGRP